MTIGEHLRSVGAYEHRMSFGQSVVIFDPSQIIKFVENIRVETRKEALDAYMHDLKQIANQQQIDQGALAELLK